MFKLFIRSAYQNVFRPAISINTSCVFASCPFASHSETLPCKAVGMLLSILFLLGKSIFAIEFLCLINIFVMYLCSNACSNSLQNTWQASQNSYVSLKKKLHFPSHVMYRERNTAFAAGFDNNDISVS